MRSLLFALALLLTPAFAAEPAVPTGSITEEMVKNLVLNWFAISNDHRPVDELLTLATDDIEFRYVNTEGVQRGHEALRVWYQDILLKAFDTTHLVENWQEIRIAGDRATVRLIVRWERREWTPGDARSRYLASLAWQTFEIVRDPNTGRVAVSAKTVDKFLPTAPVFGVSR